MNGITYDLMGNIRTLYRYAATSTTLIDRLTYNYPANLNQSGSVTDDSGNVLRQNRERLQHEFRLYLAIEDIDHTKTKAKSPQTNGICDRFHRTIQDVFYVIAFRKKSYRSIAELQADLDRRMCNYNNERTHSGKYCFGKTPMQTLIDSISLAQGKLLERPGEDQILQNPHKKAQKNMSRCI
ncbi:hypothetical protein ABID99_003483 [Mucilaginibacter sp. OAE612]